MIIDAGPSGLAVGACLQLAGIPSLIFEQSQQVGAAWRRHYDRLHLHTDKAHSELPFAPYPKDTPRYPSRLQVIQYLEAYARQFQLEPRLGQQVVAARRISSAIARHPQGRHLA
jgi:cation diffusion facilitator CzcD-associated flavoprotein CzcO